ncbi:hypothetical protein AURDEDRAFT_176755 [Auricularia subglabra TFB-10046 SS5]|uniref:Uncharacterized protein n=1 Tax=Auricularia subglabra (strain TFB-10046 / SS5) TaxID=717982 RepID=J0WQL9_AURST|nr:hypothetical protein AURDEDRAFT_176755 [Auricularia subglabra TFB-10046 SS5]
MAAFMPSSAAFFNLNLNEDFTSMPDERLSWEIHVAMLEFFPEETAIRSGLEDYVDRFAVAYPGRSQGLEVLPGEFKVVDDVRNCLYTVRRTDFTPAGIDIAPIIHRFLGLDQRQLDNRVQLCIQSMPWFESAVPIRVALSYIRGHWVPADCYLHAWELGHPRGQRFVIQTDAVNLWVRDLATNITYEVTAAKLAPGIRVRDLLRMPELLHKPGAFYERHDASREWEFGEDWSSYRAPCHATELALTAHRYWVWTHKFMHECPNSGRETTDDPVAEIDQVLLRLGIDDLDALLESAEEEELDEDIEIDEVSSRAGAEHAPGATPNSLPDSLPDLESVSDSSGDSENVAPEQSDPGEASGKDSEGDVLSVAWEEYAIGVNGPGWYHFCVRFADGVEVGHAGLLDDNEDVCGPV